MSKLVFGGSRTAPEPFDLSEPALAFSLGDADDEVVAISSNRPHWAGQPCDGR
ncbi:hypothetical protein [Streptomyces sp. NPDC018584]|uniref:hypothetical protein n=1 Tax=unclassified Streptomyces TaxID=2593676 RepID=UPI00378E82EE